MTTSRLGASGVDSPGVPTPGIDTDTPAVPGPAACTVDVTMLPANGAASSGTAVVVLTGRLDAVEAVRLRQEFATVLAAGVRLLVVDLADVHFVDSAGLAALVRARREVGSAGGTMVLVSPALPDALRVFRLTQFDEVFRMVPARGAD